MIAVRTLLSRPTAAVALAVLILVAVVTALGSVLAPSDPLAQDTSQVLAAPSAAHWLGTDYLGRDILSRLLAGTRLSVLAALEAVVIALLLGTVSAVASVFAPRGIRWVLERVFDSFMALPFITFAVAIGALLGNSIHAAMVAVGILASPTFFRVVRAVVIEIAHTQYVDAARLFGVPIPKLVLAHVVPRIVPVLLVTSASVLAGSLLVVASLTFLGVGVQPPTPTWGGMLSADLSYLAIRPFNPVAPALAIMLSVAALGILADHIRDLPARGDEDEPAGEGSTDDAPVDGRGADAEVIDRRVAGGAPDDAPVRASLSGQELSHAGPGPSRSGQDLVNIENLHVQAPSGAELVRGISLRVPKCTSVGILGESGSGKSMTCKALLGVLPDGVAMTEGRISFDGTDLVNRAGASAKNQWQDLHGKRIGAVFQDPATWFSPHLTVGSQVDEALRSALGLSRKAAAARRAELFSHVGLQDPERVAGQYVHELSGGMLQRILLAIAVSGEPDLLVADEATTALDVTVQAEVLALIRRLRESHDLTVLMISHDLAVLAHSCEYLYVFRDGEVVEHGPTGQLLTTPRHPYTQTLLADHSRFGIEAVATDQFPDSDPHRNDQGTIRP